MAIYVTNALTGQEEKLKEGHIIVDAEHVNILLKTKKVSSLVKRSNGAYGYLNVICMNRKTGDYYLKRGDKIIVEECEKIIPIVKSYNAGIIYYESFEGEGFFIVYKIDANNPNISENITIEKVKYCTLDKKTGKITGITKYRKKEAQEITYMLNKIEEIMQYIKSYSNPFTANEIKNELIQAKIIDKKETDIVLETLNRMFQSGTLEYFTGENKEIYYKAKKAKARTMAP